MDKSKPSNQPANHPASQFTHFLRTPKGILALFAAAFGLSALLAVIVAANRPFFEKYVREKYPPTFETTARILRESRGKTALPEGLLASQHELLYEAWMSAPDTLDADLPRKMLVAAPEIYLNRARRTFAAGDFEQRWKARFFLEKSGDARATTLLREQPARKWE